MKTYGNSPMENVIEFMTNISDAIFTGPPELVAKMKIGDNVEWNENGRVTRFVVTGISGCTVTMEFANTC